MKIVREFDVMGKPQGKARPRFGKNGAVYTPQSTVEYEKKIRQAYKLKHGHKPAFTGDVAVKIIAWFKQAKTNKSKYANIKPDVDNIAKAVLDALNGVAYNDDTQVTSLSICKVWCDTINYPMPCVIVRVQGYEE